MATPITVVAIQSVTPAKVTPPNLFRRISVSGNLPPSALGAHFRLLLYYRSTAGEEGSALAAASWIRETLSVALTEEPVLAGRLRRSEAAGGGWEVRFNDAGVRLVQATAAGDLTEVLDAGDREKREWGLAYWRDVETENTDQSALFYIQVTDFQGSGYSVGISCSLLLTDPLFLTRFLLKWAQIHRKMVAASGLVAGSLFHLSHFNISPLPKHLAATPAAASLTSTVLFRLPSTAYPVTGIAASPPAAMGSLALHSDHAGDLKVELWAGGGGSGGRVDAMLWEELGAGELALVEGIPPVGVSYRMVPGGNGGVVVAMYPGGGSDVLVIITVPVSAKS